MKNEKCYEYRINENKWRRNMKIYIISKGIESFTKENRLEVIEIDIKDVYCNYNERKMTWIL